MPSAGGYFEKRRQTSFPLDVYFFLLFSLDPDCFIPAETASGSLHNIFRP
jgi:hypothetical protein